MRKWFWIAPMLIAAGCSRGTKTAANPEPVDRSLSSPPAAAASGAPAAAAPAAAPAPVVIPRGTPLHVRLTAAVDSRRNRTGDRFSATLSRPLILGGVVLLPEGTRFRGHVTQAGASGRLKGRAVIGLALDNLEYQGREYGVQTTSVDRVSEAHKKRNAVLIGGGTGLGAALGALAGGPKGALIGAGAGAAAGTAGAAATGKLEVGIPAEAELRFTLRESVAM